MQQAEIKAKEAGSLNLPQNGGIIPSFHSRLHGRELWFARRGNTMNNKEKWRTCG
jgi:hypothetical protein